MADAVNRDACQLVPGTKRHIGSSLIDTDGMALRVVLASGSTRRRELLARLGVDVDVRPTDVDETSLSDEDPSDMAWRLAIAKNNAVDPADDEVVIAADTLVCIDGLGLGKPANVDDAIAMLTRLSGRTHAVMTGVSVRTPSRFASTVEVTQVRFRDLSDDEIMGYVSTGEPMDKAGAYAIQGLAGMFITAIEGSDTNVIGLPLATTVELLGRCGVTLRLSTD